MRGVMSPGPCRRVIQIRCVASRCLAEKNQKTSVLIVPVADTDWKCIHWCISRGSCTVWIHMHNYNREINNSDITMVKGSQTVHRDRDRDGGFNERKQGTAYSHHCEPLTETCFIFVFYRPWGLPTAHMEVLLWVIQSLYMLISSDLTRLEKTAHFFVICN